MSLVKHTTNLWARRRPIDNAYATVKQGDWEWRILKAYQTRSKERSNQYARVFCAVRSPLTYGTWEYGDVYLGDIPMTKELMATFRKREEEEVNAS